MFKFLTKLRNPSINGKLTHNDEKAKVVMTNINKEQSIVLLFMMIKQIAKNLHMDHRHLLNSLITLDKGIVRERKLEEKQAYRQSHKK